jgi:Xaa-Pro aminopeptidase
MQNEAKLTERYRGRRKRLMDQVEKGVILINSSGTAPDKYLKDRNLQYLTGLTDPNAYLLLAPDGVMVERLETRSTPELMRGRKVHEILFIKALDAKTAFMDGEAPTPEEIKAATGVDRVYDIAELNPTLEGALKANDILWVNTPNPPAFDQPLTAYFEFINQIRQRFYWVQLKNIATQIHLMRRIKDDYEVACLREAFEVHTEIYNKIMRTIKPGDNESLAEAIFDYEITSRDARISSMTVEHYARSIIVGSGKNTAVPHYMDNNRVIQDGDLVLLDTGVTVNGYSSDITRTFPANGRFTPRQRELYAIVLEALYTAIDTMKPGSNALTVHQTVYDVFKRYDLAQYSYGGCAHPVGLSIHDPNGRYPDDREQPFEPGVVFVVEPFLVMPHEGMGIRIEDGVLITETGYEMLPAPPKEIDELEALCQEGL